MFASIMMYKMCKTQFVLVFVTLYVGMAHSWDIAISTGDDLLSFYTNDTLTTATIIESRNITVLAYNEVHNMMMYVDKQTDSDTICGYDLTSMENKCFTEGSGRNIHGIAFDPVSERVFFTDTNERSINWISLKPEAKNNENGNLLLKMDAGIPRDIIVDSCKGYVYWHNTNLTKPLIERVRLNGTGREVFETLTSIPLNTTYIFEPNSLAIAQKKRHIVWMDVGRTPENMIEYQIFMRALDLKDKEILYHWGPLPSSPKFSHPSNALIIGLKTSIILPIVAQEVGFYRDTTNGLEFKTVQGTKMPVSLAANYKIKVQIQGVQDCEALERVTVAREYDGSFCVHGMKDTEQSVCKCTPGYTGERCEVSVCENYCLLGNCTFNDKGLPECRCNAGYTGERCAVSVCENYCFQGNCTFNNKGLPECSCIAGYLGERCEVNACFGYCLNNGDCSLNEEDEPSCQCADRYKGTRCETDTNDTLCNIPT